MKPEDIKALRKELGCSAKELAGALEVDQATVLAWERDELFPTKQYVARMSALRTAGPGSVPRKSRGPTPMKSLADPVLWGLVRKILAHKALRDEVVRLAASYSDPAED